MLDRIKRALTIDKIIICTSTNPQDDPLEEIAGQEQVSCFRGSEEDVLVRLLEAAQSHGLKYFANITADCPMMDPLLIDRTVMEYQKTDVDLLKFDDSNDDLPFCCYVVKVSALEQVCLHKKETDTEVWLKHFNSNSFLKIISIDVEDKYRHKTLKTSLDYPEDYEFIKCVFAEIHHPGTCFSMLDIIDLVKKRPDILSINANVNLTRRWLHHRQSIQDSVIK
jgi:spore coat polysaccharide biosynthesis protein SpsF